MWEPSTVVLRFLKLPRQSPCEGRLADEALHYTGHVITCCSVCLSTSTRPRNSFDANGVCSACQWAKEKKTLDWDARAAELDVLLDKARAETSSGYDCIVPVSGGKDGSYVAYKLKYEKGMNPLCVTITPPTPTSLGRKNLEAFMASGFDLLSFDIDPEKLRVVNLVGLEEMGFPYYGWLVAIQALPLRIASSLGIPLVVYGEDGEVEYGGDPENKYRAVYTAEYMKRVYLEGGYSAVLEKSGLSPQELTPFQFPEDDQLADVSITHWSYFENWDPYRNYLVAKEKCGLIDAEDTNDGTFTNFAQNDQEIYALHTYLMYLKFGFGRANQDACIEIRRGALTREQGLNLVRIYDGKLADDALDKFAAYYGVSTKRLRNIIDQWANTELFEKREGKWIPKFVLS